MTFWTCRKMAILAIFDIFEKTCFLCVFWPLSGSPYFWFLLAFRAENRQKLVKKGGQKWPKIDPIFRTLARMHSKAPTGKFFSLMMVKNRPPRGVPKVSKMAFFDIFEKKMSKIVKRDPVLVRNRPSRGSKIDQKSPLLITLHVKHINLSPAPQRSSYKGCQKRGQNRPPKNDTFDPLKSDFPKSIDNVFRKLAKRVKRGSQKWPKNGHFGQKMTQNRPLFWPPCIWFLLVIRAENDQKGVKKGGQKWPQKWPKNDPKWPLFNPLFWHVFLISWIRYRLILKSMSKKWSKMGQKVPKMAKNGSFLGYTLKICKKKFTRRDEREIDQKMTKKWPKNGQKMTKKWSFSKNLAKVVKIGQKWRFCKKVKKRVFWPLFWSPYFRFSDIYK